MICLFCKNERDESDEHVFAAPFGEVDFIVRFVCKPCNDRLGNDVDHRADGDARLSYARDRAGLPIRPQSIRSVDAATDGAGRQLRTVFDGCELASIVAPQQDGDEMVMGRVLMPRMIKEMIRSKFRKAGEAISDQEVYKFASVVLDKFDAAATGDEVTYSYRGVTIHVPRLETQNDTAGARRRDEPGAIKRVSGKIAFEVAAYVVGVDVLLSDKYDAFRDWILLGDPDLGSNVEVVREPNLEGCDAERNHSVLLEEAGGVLYAIIAFYEIYVLRVRIGDPVGLAAPWTGQFPAAEI